MKLTLPVVIATATALLLSIVPLAPGANASTRTLSASLSGASLTAIFFDSPGADTGSNTSRNGEWVLIKNTTHTRRVLTGWTLRDASSHVYTFPSFALGAGKSVKLHTGSGTNTAANLYWRSSGYIWNNTGDTAFLKNAHGTLLDRCKYTSAAAPEAHC